MGDMLAPSHIITIILVALLLFGPKKLPELGRGAGMMMREFKNGLRVGDPDERPAEQPKQLTESAPSKD
ncbi:twin-arginine translocase TatA/TatE family subunit [Paenibacillus hodogayensis]|uniref:Sec-independent protein translocase protein TatA n=1 Tax=Paenibacillus hodogayensis TaxID=279208 RepID=A0ABV5VQC8_9BACL